MSVFPARVSQAVVNELRLDLPEPPSANVMWKKWRNRMVLTPEGKAYKAAVRAVYYREFRTTKVAFPDGFLALQMVWTRGRKSGDLDNRLKLCGDSLKGLVFKDDKQITEIHAYRRDQKGAPGIVVVVSRVAATDPTAPYAAHFKHYTEGET